MRMVSFCVARFRHFLGAVRVVRVSPLLEALRKTPDFPHVASTQLPLLEISLMGYQNTFRALSSLLAFNHHSNPPNVYSAGEMFSSDEQQQTLRNLFDFYGSDKGKKHDYDLVYSHLLEDRKASNLDIFEIGLGTNNIDTPSNMGKDGSPGASLRAWRDFFPNAAVVGADVDKRILFSEANIVTYELDQTSAESWKLLKARLGKQMFDLIIDDGLHAPFANLTTLIEGSSLLKEKGIIVIEDVPDRSLAIWKVVPLILGKDWQVQIVRGKVENLIIFRKN
jgi:hypothetical protein